MLGDLYKEWNARINVISRKDIDNIYTHHVLHSLAIAKAVEFKANSSVLDFGTGGGFPGVPLAIMFPDTRFKLIDGTGKKIRVVNAVAQALGLANCEGEHLRGEDERGRYDYVVSRAVMPLPDMVKIVRKNVATHGSVVALKGGDLSAELRPFGSKAKRVAVSEWFVEEWFNDKYVIRLAL